MRRDPRLPAIWALVLVSLTLAVAPAILAHLGLPTERSDPCPSRPPPGRTGDLFADLSA